LNLWKIRIIEDDGTQAWTTVNRVYESAHNYDNNYVNTWIISHPGASRMMVHFKRQDIERGWDKLYLLDKNDHEIICYSNDHMVNVWSPIVEGDVVKLKLITDYSVVRYGFKVDKYRAIGGNTLPEDTIPPSMVASLVDTEHTKDSVTLRWIATGDDDNRGQATSYDIRYSTSVITEANWEQARQWDNDPVPGISGSVESIRISKLQANTTYYFGIRAIDEAGNISPIAVISAKTKGIEVIDISMGEEIRGGFSSTGERWYKLHLSEQTKVKITLRMDSGGRL
jgi:hypothetical protein